MQNFNQSLLPTLINKIKLWGIEIGFAQIEITFPQLQDQQQSANLAHWLHNGNNGEMLFMHQHLAMRSNPHKLMPEAQSVICCRLDYPNNTAANSPAFSPEEIISYYALCHDYHKTMRIYLQRLAKKIAQEVNEQSFHYRIFCDSAPLLEKALAAQAGVGWQGKNSLLINDRSGSYFFLGEIFTNLTLVPHNNGAANIATTNTNTAINSAPLKISSRCGTCTKCIESCPTQALSQNTPYVLDARRCIAYLTIEHQREIPVELRPLIGTRIFGCTACQQCCPWNKKSPHIDINIQQLHLSPAAEQNTAFSPKPSWLELLYAGHNNLSHSLATLFLWDEAVYLKNSEGTPLRRLGYERWLRNIAIALGNSEATSTNLAALHARSTYPSALVREHVAWAIRNLSLQTTK
jgi:epoxyqueuosine reductase